MNCVIEMKVRTWLAKLVYNRRHRGLPRIGTDNPLSRASDGQDIYVAEMLPNEDGSRLFVEIGGNDGVTLSNTYFLETEHGWGGCRLNRCRALIANLQRTARASP